MRIVIEDIPTTSVAVGGGADRPAPPTSQLGVTDEDAGPAVVEHATLGGSADAEDTGGPPGWLLAAVEAAMRGTSDAEGSAPATADGQDVLAGSDAVVGDADDAGAGPA